MSSDEEREPIAWVQDHNGEWNETADPLHALTDADYGIEHSALGPECPQ